MVPRGARRGAGLPRARALLVPARTRRRTATQPPNGWQSIFGGTAWTRRRRRRADGTCTSSRRSSPTSTGRTPTSGRSTRTCCASGSTAASPASASTRPRCCQGPGASRGAPRRRPGRAPVHRPRRAARRLPPLARDRRRLRRAARARRRDLAPGRRAARALPAAGRAAHRVQLRLPRCPGSRGAIRASIDASLAVHAPVGAPADLGALEPRRHAAGHALRARRHARSPSRRSVAGTPTDLDARHTPGARRGAAHDGAAGLDVRLPGRGARPARGRGHPVRTPPGPDVAALGRRRSRPRRLPRADPVVGRPAAVRLQPRRGRAALARPAGRLGAAHGRGAERTTRRRCSRSTATACASAATAPGARRRSVGCPLGTLRRRRSRSRAATRFACVVNFGPDPVALPAGAVVLIASGELEGGALPQDTTVWLLPGERWIRTTAGTQANVIAATGQERKGR